MLIAIHKLLLLLAAYVLLYGAWYTLQGVKFIQTTDIKTIIATGRSSSSEESNALLLLAGYAVVPAMTAAGLLCIASAIRSSSHRHTNQSRRTEQPQGDEVQA